MEEYSTNCVQLFWKGRCWQSQELRPRDVEKQVATSIIYHYWWHRKSGGILKDASALA